MAMVFFCDRCKRRESKDVPNSQKGGIITNYRPENQADLDREACLEACDECYNNYLWWKGEGGEPRNVSIGEGKFQTLHEVPQGASDSAFKFDIRVRLHNGTIESESFSVYHSYCSAMMTALEAATIMVLRSYKLLP